MHSRRPSIVTRRHSSGRRVVPTLGNLRLCSTASAGHAICRSQLRRHEMRTLMIFAMATQLAIGLTAAPEQNTARGTVTAVRVARGKDVGEYLFTVQGRNPCGAVHVEYGDGQ